MMHFIKESRIAAPRSVVFAFHERPGVIAELSPPWDSVRILEGADSIRPGSRVTLGVRVGPIFVRWVAEHTEYLPNSLFVDRQLRGPFASWTHRHLFLDDEAGGTILRDEIAYEPPLGRLGQALGGRWIEAKLTRTFNFRHEITRRLVEAQAVSSYGFHESMKN